jgi:hypothetical protein
MRWMLVLLVTTTAVYAQPSVDWTRVYGRGYNEQPMCVLEMPDGGYAVGGIHAGTSNAFRVWRFGADGEWLSTRDYVHTVGGVNAMAIGSNGGLALTGYGGSSQTAVIIQLDQSGNIYRSRYFGYEHTVPVGIAATPDSGFIVISSDNWYNHGDSLLFTRFGGNGQVAWQITRPDWKVNCVILLHDGNVIAAGRIRSNGNWEPRAIKFTTGGDVVWERSVGLPELEITGLAETGDGGFLVAQGAIITRTSALGIPVWTYEASDALPGWNHILAQPIVTSDNSYLVLKLGSGTRPGWGPTMLIPQYDVLSENGQLIRSHVVGRVGGWDSELVGAASRDGGAIICGTVAIDTDSLTLFLSRTCPADVVSGQVQVIESRHPTETAVRLIHAQGEIFEWSLTHVGPGLRARVGSTPLWDIPENGDGNDGDSIIFRARMPLRAGSIDTFFVEADSCASAMIYYTVGCHEDSLAIFHGYAAVGGLIADPTWGGFNVSFHSRCESLLDHWELISAPDWSPELAETTRLTPANDLGGATYSDIFLPAYFRRIIHPEVVDSFGCRVAFEQYTIVAVTNPADDHPLPVAAEFSLAAYPNPFNAETTIELELARPRDVHVRIVNVLGQEVARLWEGRLEAGPRTLHWNASANASGLYFAVAQAGGTVRTTKLLLLK